MDEEGNIYDHEFNFIGQANGDDEEEAWKTDISRSEFF